jgi:hypothetical membrane protein
VSRRSVRLLAIGGALGPLTFVATWLIAGAVTNGYSPVEEAISDLAATDAGTRVAMTLGFIAFGAGVVAFGVALRGAGAGPAWISAVATACFTLGVAATPLGAPTRDVVHGTFASLGYLTLVGVPLLSARTLARAGRAGWAGYSRVTAALAALCLLATAIGPAHGLIQRTGLTVGDIWLVTIAVRLTAGDDLFAARAGAVPVAIN